MQPTIKIKGSEIINRWNKLNDLVKTLGKSLGEKGWFFREHGYDVTYDGFSVCHVECSDIKLRFDVSNCCDSIWKLSKKVMGHGFIGYIKDKYSSAINPDKEYDVPLNLSIAKKVESGYIKPKRYIVTDNGRRKYKKLAAFSDLNDAQNFAEKQFNEQVERISKDRDLRQFCYARFQDSWHTAKEKGEIRHYAYYNYKGSCSWIAIEAEV